MVYVMHGKRPVKPCGFVFYQQSHLVQSRSRWIPMMVLYKGHGMVSRHVHSIHSNSSPYLLCAASPYPANLSGASGAHTHMHMHLHLRGLAKRRVHAEAHFTLQSSSRSLVHYRPTLSGLCEGSGVSSLKSGGAPSLPESLSFLSQAVLE